VHPTIVQRAPFESPNGPPLASPLTSESRRTCPGALMVFSIVRHSAANNCPPTRTPNNQRALSSRLNAGTTLALGAQLGGHNAGLNAALSDEF